MTLTELKYIIAVAREKHFGKAANACFVSQPTLSVAVKKLEDELDVQIFQRQTGDILLTPHGRLLIEQAQRILDEAKRFTELAKIGVNPMKGPLRLGTIYTIAPYLLPKLICTSKKDLPDIPLFLHETFTATLLEMLKQGELDCAILAIPFQMQGLEVIEVYDEPYLVCVPQNHEWAKRTTIEPFELSTQNMFLLGAGHCFRDHVLQVCPELNRVKSWNEDEPNSYEGSSLETIRQMVVGGIGITVLPRTSVTDSQMAESLIRYIPFTNPQPQRRIVMVYRKGMARVQAVEALAQAVKNCTLPSVVWL